MEIYNPVKHFHFAFNKCFITGSSQNIMRVPVLQPWLLQQAGIQGTQPFKLLNEKVTDYDHLQLPMSAQVYQQFYHPVQQAAEAAFAGGYASVAQHSRQVNTWLLLFMFGLLYNEMHELYLQHGSGAAQQVPQGLQWRFHNLYTLIYAEYCGAADHADGVPGSLVITQLTENDVPFQFKSDLYQQIFTLQLHNFGIIACPQDLESNSQAHAQLLHNISGQSLSLQQFHELSARFFYTAFLFRQLFKLNIQEYAGMYSINYMPFTHMSGRLFDRWDNRTYASVLEKFWEPYGITRFELLKDEENIPSAFSSPAFPAL